MWEDTLKKSCCAKLQRCVGFSLVKTTSTSPPYRLSSEANGKYYFARRALVYINTIRSHTRRVFRCQSSSCSSPHIAVNVTLTALHFASDLKIPSTRLWGWITTLRASFSLLQFLGCSGTFETIGEIVQSKTMQLLPISTTSHKKLMIRW